MLKRCAVIGKPISHSLSPAIHAAAYRELGLDWEYTAIEVSEDSLPNFIDSLDESWVGLSVTMPLKHALLSCGKPDALATLAAAGNTFLVASGLVTNTDIAGFQRALPENGTSARLIGGGGTGRAAIVALANSGIRYLNLVLRNTQKAKDVVALANSLDMEVAVDPLGVPLSPAEITVCALPPLAADDWLDFILADTEFCLDVAYDPWKTSLTKKAEEMGIQSASGIDLLAGQAVEQVKLMTGKDVDFDLLKNAALSELLKRQAEAESLMRDDDSSE